MINNQTKVLFNPEGSDDLSNRRIIKGNPTNMLNLNTVKYKWAPELYREMMANFWVPEKVDMTKDVPDYRNLEPSEMKGFDNTISFLNFLDSLQTHNLPNVADYITAPEVSALFAVQTYQEVVHSQSYQYIFESVIPASKRESVIYLWRDNKLLLERNKYIANIYQSFIDSPTDGNLAKVLAANYALESLYFYNGFYFFYGLAFRNILIGTSQNIRYINRDELTHVTLFQNVIREINAENPNFVSEEIVHEIFEQAVIQEIEWACESFGHGVIGINESSITQFTKHQADKRIQQLGIAPLYGGDVKHPYKHVDHLSAEANKNQKGNFFESTVINYDVSSVYDGWEEI